MYKEAVILLLCHGRPEASHINLYDISRSFSAWCSTAGSAERCLAAFVPGSKTAAHGIFHGPLTYCVCAAKNASMPSAMPAAIFF